LNFRRTIVFTFDRRHCLRADFRYVREPTPRQGCLKKPLHISHLREY
jgi:hypothetical protein